MLQQIIADPLGIGFRLVTFIDRHNHRTFCSLGMVDRLDRLHHHRIIGSHNKDHNIGDVGPAGPHFGKGLMARRIDKGDQISGHRVDLIGTDMLGDTARFACRHISAANCVQKTCLAVIDMAHNRDNRWPRLEAAIFIIGTFQPAFHIRFRHALRPVAQFLRDQLGGLAINRLGCCGHHAKLHQFLDDISCTLCHPVGKFGDRNGVGNNHVPYLFDLRLFIPHPRLFTLTAD